MLRVPFILIANLIGFLRHMLSRGLYGLRRAARRNKRVYVTVELESSYALGSSPTGLARFASSQPSFLQLREDFKRLGADSGVAGVILRAPTLAMGLARSGDLGALIDGLRAANKHVVVHAEMATTAGLHALSRADDVVLTPAGRFYSFGLRFDQLFAKDLLERVGVKAQFIHIGPFKTATHRFHKQRPTAAQDLMMRGLHSELMDVVTQRLGARDGSSQERARDALAHAPLDVDAATRYGLASGEAYYPELPRWIARVAGLTPAASRDTDDLPPHPIVTASLSRHLARSPRPWSARPMRRRPRRLAVIDLSGTIKGDDGSNRGNAIRPKPVLAALRRAVNDPRVAGILIHVNSPGGSALASDIIWDALRRARAKKPIVCYCSDVAASGGYYIAVGCDHIVCRPETLTGSIGVISGTFSVGQVLDKVGVHVDSIFDDDVTAFNSIYAPLDDPTMSRLRDDARAFYRRFLDRVGAARDIPRRRLHRFARGRVYSGREAYQRGLVDQLGGLEDAITELARRADLDPDTATLTYVPVGKPSLRDVLTGQVSAAARAELAPLGIADLFADAATLTDLARHEHVLALADLKIARG